MENYNCSGLLAVYERKYFEVHLTTTRRLNEFKGCNRRMAVQADSLLLQTATFTEVDR